MPEYRYRAVDERGRDVSGTMEEDSAVRVVAILQEQGLQVSAIEAVTGPGNEARQGGSLSWEDVDLFAQQLLAITRSGLPLAPALKAVAHELGAGRLKEAMDGVRGSLESGHSLEDALAARKQEFPPVFRAILSAGERSGNLPGVLENLCGFTRRMLDTRTRMQEALAYPGMVILVSVLVLLFFLARILPQFGEVFKDFGAQLPTLTRFWLDIAYVVNNNLMLLVSLVVAAVLLVFIGTRVLRRSDSLRYYVDAVKERIPVIGRVYVTNSRARFCQTLGTLLHARVPLADSMQLAGATADNAVLMRAVSAATASVLKGSSIAVSLEATRYFDRSFTWLVGIAEERGDLEAALINIASTYEEQAAQSERTALGVLPPMLLFFVAFIVLSIIVSIYLPIFTLADVVSGS
ncbi:MAG: type II secretion system F family protein [Candidatus Hydrogenedentes bacterium]|nr:type II secretion system F family protein [Candidatus Hydrogenedentota bacterium]